MNLERFRSSDSHVTRQHQNSEKTRMSRAHSMSYQSNRQNPLGLETCRSTKSGTLISQYEKKEVLMRYVKECTFEQFQHLFEIGSLKDMPLMHLVVLDPQGRTREAKVKYLIQHKAGLSQFWEVSQGKCITPLHLAIESIKVLTLMALIEAGANVNAIGKYPIKSLRNHQKWVMKTPLDVSPDDEILVNYLKRQGAKTYRELTPKRRKKSLRGKKSLKNTR